MRIACGIAALAVVAVACGVPRASRPTVSGFTTASAGEQLALERRFLTQPDTERLRAAHRELTRKPHVAGSLRDRELADWTAKQFTDAGMEDVRIVTHEVMLPRPLEIAVEMTAPVQWRAAMRESPVADPDTHIDVRAEAMPFHAYSASGEVTAPVVFAGGGSDADYDYLERRGVDVRGKIVLVAHASVPRYTYRGYKAWLAQQRGAAGILMFSDPRDEADGRTAVYPDGPRAPDSLIERGGIIYDFLVPGDPLTPGWPSIAGTRRIARKDAVSLPGIVSVPLSSQDARRILVSLGGPPAPDHGAWQTSSTVSPHVGPGPAIVRMKVKTDDSVRPVWTVTGMFRGSAWPDEVVILGNHRDAWVYGGADPSSGSAAMFELARSFGALVRQGWRPRRSIMFASWDAEEFALTSSTEWVEQHEDWLRERAVAYLNVDSGVSGSRLAAGSVPSLNRAIAEAADAVRDPATGVTLGTLLRDRAAASAGTPRLETIDDRLGGGSDYIAFLDFAGVPVADLAFEGPHGVYHSLYDTHQWVMQFADPGFRYHVALVQLWGIVAMRIANADALPIDPGDAAGRIAEYVDAAAKQRRPGGEASDLPALRDAAARLKTAAAVFGARRDAALAAHDNAALNAVNRQAMQFERAFLDAGGLEGRTWYRHLIHAPNERYEPVMLPGLVAAIGRRDPDRIDREVGRLVAAFDRAARVLERP